MHSRKIIRSAWVAGVVCSLSAAAFTAELNDSGQTLCYNASDTAVACSAAVSGDTGVNPGQDGRFGRDSSALNGVLTKVGAGAAGFDYTKIANNGNALAASAVLGSAAANWACTRDNVTGLIWEVKTAVVGLRRGSHEYTWYSTTAATNGGQAGAQGTNTCANTLSSFSNQCNTQNYVAAVNAATLCGASDWRLPTQRELLTIVNSGASAPAIDENYFPNMVGDTVTYYWTSTTRADIPTNVWPVSFERGRSVSIVKTLTYPVILVRGGQ